MSMAGKSAFLSIPVFKILGAGRKKAHKNLVRKRNLTFTGYTVVCLKTGLCISYHSPEDHFQQGKGGSGICGGFPRLPKVRLVL